MDFHLYLIFQNNINMFLAVLKSRSFIKDNSITYFGYIEHNSKLIDKDISKLQDLCKVMAQDSTEVQISNWFKEEICLLSRLSIDLTNRFISSISSVDKSFRTKISYHKSKLFKLWLIIIVLCLESKVRLMYSFITIGYFEQS